MTTCCPIARIRGVLASLLGILSVVLSAPHTSWAAACDELTYRIEKFTVGDRAIRAEIYEPKLRGRFPIILLLHGTAGVFTPRAATAPERENFGEQTIACHNFVTVLVHYFDTSGILSTNDIAFVRAHFSEWLRTASTAVDFATTLKRGDPKRIGLYGESLGGYLAVTLGLTDPRIRAVSVYSAGLPPVTTVRSRPRVLIQHGESDSIVPPSEAMQLRSFLVKHHVPSDLRFYPGRGHNLSEVPEVLETTVTFFSHALRK